MAPVTPQIPASIREGAQTLGWYQNPAFKNMSFGTGFNQPAGGASNPLGSFDAKIKALQERGIDVKPYIGSLLESDTLNSMINRPVDLEAQAKILQMNEDSQLRVAKERQKLGEESTKKALLYTSLGNLGNQIATGIGGTPEQWKQMYNIPAVYNDTLRAFPKAEITPSATSAIGQRNYFG
jgi:hypothetical protein